jgi:hypothetical protein
VGRRNTVALDEQRFALRGGSLFTRALSPYFLDETTTI